MEITKVKIKGDGYLVNDTLSVPNAPGNRHYQMIQEWIAVGNEVESEFTPEELAAKQQAEVEAEAKAEADRLEYQEFLAWKAAKDSLEQQ